jgi:hypothetical protein
VATSSMAPRTSGPARAFCRPAGRARICRDRPQR